MNNNIVNNALKYYQNATYHLERVRRGYKSFMDTMNIPKTGLLSVIDVGVGSGRVSNEVVLPLLPKNVNEIVLTDMDEGMLEFTRSVSKDSRLKFEKLNMQDKSLPEHLQRRFDLLFSSYCFSYLTDLRQGFKNCGRLLKPDGQLLNLFQYKKNGLYTTYRRMSKMEKWEMYTKDYANFRTILGGENPEEELKTIFKDIGMTLVRYEFDPDNCLEMTKRQILEAYLSLDKIYLQIPKQQQEDYMKDFLRIFSEETEVDFDEDLDVPTNFNFPTVTVHAKN